MKYWLSWHKIAKPSKQKKNKVFFNTYSTRKTTESQKNNTKFNVLCLSYSKNNWFSFQQKHTATILKNNTIELLHPKNATRRRHSLPTADRKYVTEFCIHRNLSEKCVGGHLLILLYLSPVLICKTHDAWSVFSFSLFNSISWTFIE